MILKISYEGWKYFEADRIDVLGNKLSSQGCSPNSIHLYNDGYSDSSGQDVSILLIKIYKNDKEVPILVDLRSAVYILNNEGKTVDRL